MSTAECQAHTYNSTVADMSAQTGFSRVAITKWVRSGLLTAETDGKCWRLNEDEVMRVAATKKTRKKFVVYRAASSP